jgi:zinc/manganese transport system substrate-binding protein
VVAGENFWGNVASQIGGSHIKVTSIITDPNADPHSYETDPRDAAALSNSTFVIKNGLGYDDFIDKLLATNPNPDRVVLSIAEALGVGGDNPNPHLCTTRATWPGQRRPSRASSPRVTRLTPPTSLPMGRRS